MTLCKRMTEHDPPTLYTVNIDAQIAQSVEESTRLSTLNFPHKSHMVSYKGYRPDECDELCPGRTMEMTFGTLSFNSEQLATC